MSGNSGWLTQSIVATALVVPIWLAIGFLNRNFHVRPDVFLVWYSLGAATASACFSVGSLQALVPSWRSVAVVVGIGLTAGAISNIAMYRAVASAPNPGLPVAIANGAAIGTFLGAVLLSRWFPAYFDSVRGDLRTFLGIVLTVFGGALIVIRR